MARQYKKDKIYFHIPGIVDNLALNTTLLSRMEEEPSHFYDNVCIGSIFGCFPSSKWNGGRLSIGYIDKHYIPRTFKFINDAGIPIRLTWTNPVLDEKDLEDKMCNYITAVGENGLNEVLVNTDLMEDFIRTEYGLYPIVSSTTKRLNDIDALNQELNKDYHMVVIDYDFNNKWDILQQIQKPEKCEILINPVCNPKCPLRKEHYKYIGEKQKDVTIHDDRFESGCMAMYRMNHEIKQLPTFVSVEDLYSKYIEMGFQHFKIEGRFANPCRVAMWYVYYMVKPEYREIEFDYLIRGTENGIISPMVPIYSDDPNES